MSIGPELAQAWERTLQVLLASREIAGVNKAMLRDTFPLGLVEDTVLVAAPNEFTQKTLETRLRPALTAALGAELGREIKLAVTVETRPDSAPTRAQNGFSAPAAKARGEDPGADQAFEDDEDDEDDESSTGFRSGLRAVGNSPGSARVQPRSHPPARLNPKYTFENFVIGNSNRFAHAAAYAAAEIGAYNPLFIYGDSGLGKTHLLHAIGHYSEAFFPQHRVKYFTTEEFTNDFINLVHAGRAEDFRRRYRDVDLLLIDDVQFLERAERTQEEFFHTFNTLHNATKQIVISSDRPPKQLTTLEERLRTRFEWGLCADVHAPDLETRIAILRMKADGDVLPRLSGEVLEYIASRIQTNIRELEGALIRVNAYGSLNRCDVTVQLAEEVLRDQFPDTQGPQITATLIVSVTSEYFALDSEDIKGGGRNRVLVNARQIAMYLCREMTELSLPQIGTIFGNKDHTTVMHAVRKINALMAERRQVFQQVTELTARIKARARQ